MITHIELDILFESQEDHDQFMFDLGDLLEMYQPDCTPIKKIVVEQGEPDE